MSTDVISSRAMQWASKVQSIADQARDLTLEAAQSVGARYADESKAVDINKLLEGRSDREKIDGMRRTIAISSRGTDMSEHFASVVKNVASPNLELRKLVYIYITRYAESQPDLALLSINTIQKALSDQNQIVRALALRVMSSIRVPSISGIILLAIKKCMSDSSFYVRKTAAIAITKTIQLDPSLTAQLLDCLKALLTDTNPAVLAAVIETHEAICPDRIDLIHPHYRRICQLLGQMDEFTQVNVIHVLTSYCRRCFVSPHLQVNDEPLKDFYEQNVSNGIADQDLTLFTKSLLPLLASRSSAVVLAAVRALDALTSSAELYKVAEPLIALLRQSQDIQFVVLTNIAVIAHNNPAIWHKYSKHFFIYPTEPEHIWKLKLEIMTLIISEDNSTLILSELAQYSSDTTNDKLSKSATHAIGKCAQQAPSIAGSAIDILFSHLRSAETGLISESVVAIRHLVQLNPSAHFAHIRTLIKTLPKVVAPVARASIFWLVSENLTLLQRYAPDVLRLGAKSFPEEDEQVRLQILTLAVKLYVLHSQRTNEQDVEEMNTALKEADDARQAVEHESSNPDTDHNDEVKADIETEALPETSQAIPETDSIIPKLYAHITQLTRYDVSYDLRDRLRTYKILASSPNWVLTQKLLFSALPIPAVTSASTTRSRFAIGSTSMIADSQLPGYLDLPPWSTVIIGKAERNVETAQPDARQGQSSSLSSSASASASRSSTLKPAATPATSTLKARSKLTGISSLDDFYATSSSSSSSEEESSDEEDDSSGESASEEDDDSHPVEKTKTRDQSESSGEEESSEEEDESDEEEDKLLVQSR